MNNELKEIKKSIVKMANYSHSSHIGSALSVVDILYILYKEITNINKNNLTSIGRDKVILSKGHASMALYSVLGHLGLINKEYLNKFYINDGKLCGHLDKTISPAIDCSSGSLGHGLSIGIGMAMADKKNNIYVILGDGECDEGSVWESFMLLGQLRLTNIIVIIDMNSLQGNGLIKDIIDISNLPERLKTFNLDVVEINGNDLNDIKNGFNKITNKTRVIVAHTIKGNGISYMENQLKWHYKSPNDEEMEIALKELE